MEKINVIHEKCKAIFEQELIEPDGPSFACKMADAMTDVNSEQENCIGENFNQLIISIDDEFFKIYVPASNTGLDFYFSTYIFWLYLIVERIDFVFDVLNKDNKSKLFSDFKHNNFQTCIMIKKWANFIKHPKEFIFSHWPKYQFEGTDLFTCDKTVIIDRNFIIENYTKSDSRVQNLENCNSVIVLIPELTKLTSDFCKEFNTFIDFICNNKIVSDYLRKKSTIDYFYDANESKTTE